MDKKCSQLIIGQSIIHSFNPKPFKNMDTAIYALNNKELRAGEIAIAYYNDPTETRGIGAIVATGNILPGGNQIFKNTAYTDKLIKNVKELIESNSVDISVIEENVNKIDFFYKQIKYCRYCCFKNIVKKINIRYK